jgi:ABC-type branched-subunit amino acid transport system permease subunit
LARRDGGRAADDLPPRHGPLIPGLGASLVILAREILSDYFRSWLIFVGLVYIALVVFLPSGLYPLFARPRPRRRSP